MPTSMLNVVYNTDSKKKHSQLVHVIKNGLSDLEDEVEKMSEDVKESEKPDKIVDIVKKVLEFDKKNQEGQLLKLISTGQLLGRLPITVAHLKT